MLTQQVCRPNIDLIDLVQLRCHKHDAAWWTEEDQGPVQVPVTKSETST